MKRSLYWYIGIPTLMLVLATLIPVLVVYAGEESNEQTVELKDCPDAVQKTILKHAQGGQVMEVEKETAKDGKVTFEAEVKKADGKTVDIEVAADGTFLKEEAEDDDSAGEDSDDDASKK